MKSTILQIIVKEWFKDRLGGELDDGVLEAIIKELTEKKDNRITITDIEPKSSRIHYESKKDAEPLEESEWISVNDRMPEEFRRESKYIEFKTLSGMLIDGYSKRNAFYDSKYGSIITSIVTHWKYKNNEPKEESEWISVKDRMPEESKFKAEDYLVFNDQGEIEVCFINNRVFRDKREDRNVIASHWRHLPEPPKNK